MKKVYVTLTVDIIIEINENERMNEVMENLFVASDSEIVYVEDSIIRDYKITDAK